MGTRPLCLTEKGALPLEGEVCEAEGGGEVHGGSVTTEQQYLGIHEQCILPDLKGRGRTGEGAEETQRASIH